MIYLFDDYYIFKYEDVVKYKNLCSTEDNRFTFENFIIDKNGIVYSDLFTIRLLANNYSKYFKMLSNRRSFEENYCSRWLVNNQNIFPGYFDGLLESMDWNSSGEPNNYANFKTIIGKGYLLKFWINSKENDDKNQNEKHQVGETISFCKDSKYSMSFDNLPSEYKLPIVLKKI